MSDKIFVNDPIGQMRKENKDTVLFEGVAVIKDDETGEPVIYHEACDQDIFFFDKDEAEFSDILEEVLKHLAECDPDEEDNDPWEDVLDDEEIEPL